MPQAAQQPRNEDGPTTPLSAQPTGRQPYGGCFCDMCTHRARAGPAAASRRVAPAGRCQPEGDPPGTAPARLRARHTAPGDGRRSVSGTVCQRAVAAEARPSHRESRRFAPCYPHVRAPARRGRVERQSQDPGPGRGHALVARRLRRDTCCAPPPCAPPEFASGRRRTSRGARPRLVCPMAHGRRHAWRLDTAVRPVRRASECHLTACCLRGGRSSRKPWRQTPRSFGCALLTRARWCACLMALALLSRCVSHSALPDPPLFALTRTGRQCTCCHAPLRYALPH